MPKYKISKGNNNWLLYYGSLFVGIYRTWEDALVVANYYIDLTKGIKR